MCTIKDDLSRLDIDSLKLQQKEVLTILSRSEKNSISIIEFPMHIALIFKEQAKAKYTGLREEGLS
jgi:hypothetical protein